MSDKLGQQIGNYRLVRLLGTGSFAEVYLGQHRYLHSTAALKVLRLSLRDREAKRFLEEAQTLVRLKHSHIVRMLDFAVEQGVPVLVMDYAPGGTLRQRHPHGTRLTLTTVASYVQQIATALQYAHNQHVIHRDVKPENLLLGPDHRLLLSDFGLALFAPSLDLLSTQELIGTLPYTAPEQLRGKPDFASDQYALGIVTYEWLCGRRPFEGHGLELIRQHLSVAPPPLREYCPALPPAVEQVVLRALAKDPQQRYVSVQAFAQALERACREHPSDEDLSQMTVPLPTISRSSLFLPATCPVFLSAAPADELVATQLREDLQQRGVLFSNEITGGLSQQEDAMHQAIRAVGLVVVVGTPQMRSSRLVKEQLRIAQMYQRRLVLLWAQGNDLSAMLQDPLWAQLLPVEVIDARGTRYPAALEELLACLQQNPLVSSLGEVTYAPVPEEPRNPYKGLRAFTQQDVGDFFGRDALIQDLLASLKDVLTSEPSAPVRPRLLTLLGPSGSGKSSVLLAGLLPQLKSAALPMSNEWVYLEPIMPGNRPLEALQLALASHFPERSGKAIREDLEEDSARGLHLLARQLVKQPTKRVLLVIDQFEEVFTQTSGEQERQRFIDLLVTAATEPKGPMVILLTLRTDFYERLLSYPDLFRLIEHQHHVVLPMQLHELRAIIEQPAALPDVQVTFEGQLVGDLLFEAQGQVGALPLLEFTLDQLFQQRSDRCLTLAAYQQLGGIKGALAKHAEATYAALPSDEHRKLARALFLRLIEPGISEQDSTRRRANLSELFLPDARQTSIIHEVAEAFVRARLLTTNELAGTSTIEVSHEALIREWKRLSEWLREAREDIRLQQTISEDAMEWRRHGKSNDRLYRGSHLAEATEWVKRNVASSEETEFLQTSVTRERQARSRRNLLVGVTSLVLLVMLVAALVLQGNLLQTQARLLASLPVSVTNLNDHGPGSLRQAIATAPSGSAITFAKNLQGTIQLTSGELMITKNVVISGPGADFLAISGGSSSRVFDINQATVTISNLTIKNSHARINGEGRAGSSSGAGGGIFVHLGSLVLLNSIVTDNTADSQGGGIYNLGTLTLIDSTVSNNMSGDSGGGLLNYGTLTLTNSTVVGNVSQNRGGGIYNDDYSMLTLTNATISGNKAVREGGGLFGVGDTGQGQFALVYCTVYDNTASTGGGIVSTPKTTVNTMAGSIVADNHALSSPDIAGALLLSFPNLVQNPAGATFVAGDSFVPPLTSLSPRLGPLHNNGGATPTHALLAGSLAIDQIPYAPNGYATICGRYSIYTTDQRGVKRPQGKKCDIGAYEYVSS